MNKTVTPEGILRVLETEEFHRWYREEFNDFVAGDACAPTRAEILETIQDLF